MTTITVQKIWPIDAGKASGNFKGADGITYKCGADTHALLREGQTFDVAVKVSEWQGKAMNWLPRGFVPPKDGAAPAPQAPQQSHPAAPPQSNGARMADPKDTLIFVTGVVGRAMGSGNFGVTDIDILTKAALAAYRANLA